MNIQAFSLCLCWALLATTCLARDFILSNGSAIEFDCPRLRRITDNTTVSPANYTVFPTIAYKTFINGSIYDIDVFSANPDPDLENEKVDCANISSTLADFCNDMAKKIVLQKWKTIDDVEWVDLHFIASYKDGGSTIYCKTPAGFASPPKAGDEIRITIYDSNSMEFNVMDGADKLPGVDEGQLLNASCGLNISKGDGKLPLAIQFSTTKKPKEFLDLPIINVSPSEVQLKDVVLNKTFYKLKCVFGETQSPLKVIESKNLQVRFKPYNMVMPHRNPIKLFSADGNAINKTIFCVTNVGNPAALNWTVEAEVDGKLRPDIIHNVNPKIVQRSGRKIATVNFVVTVDEDTKVLCSAKNDVGATELEISIQMTKKETPVNPTPDPLKPWIPTIVSIIVAVHVFIGLLILLVLCCFIRDAKNREKESLLK